MLQEIDRVALYLPDTAQNISAEHKSKIANGMIQYYDHWADQLQPALAEVKLVATAEVAELADRLSAAFLEIGRLADSSAPYVDYYPYYFQIRDMLEVVINATRTELGRPDTVIRRQSDDWPWLPDRPSRESYVKPNVRKSRQPPE
jgi:hypothetical protein